MMRAATPNSQGNESQPMADVRSGETHLIDGDRPSDPLCPLKTAVRDELHALGVGVLEVHRYLHCGDLGNAEEVLGNIFSRLKENFCSPEPSQCEWVREGSPGLQCGLLQSHQPEYLIPPPKPFMNSTEDASATGASATDQRIEPQQDVVRGKLSNEDNSASLRFSELLDQAMRF